MESQSWSGSGFARARANIASASTTTAPEVQASRMLGGFRRLQPRIDDSRIKLVAAASAELHDAGLAATTADAGRSPHRTDTASIARLPEVNIAIRGPDMAGD